MPAAERVPTNLLVSVTGGEAARGAGCPENADGGREAHAGDGDHCRWP
jgi:hypothetical protein